MASRVAPHMFVFHVPASFGAVGHMLQAASKCEIWHMGALGGTYPSFWDGS